MAIQSSAYISENEISLDIWCDCIKGENENFNSDNYIYIGDLSTPKNCRSCGKVYELILNISSQ